MFQTSPKRVLFVRSPRRLWLGVFLAIFFLASAFSLLSPSASADTSDNLNFQARLETADGSIVPDGNYNVEFKLYDSSSSTGSSQGSCTGDSSCLWTETRTGANQVKVVDGYLAVNLGSVTAFPTSINWDQQLYLTMNIGGTGATASWDGEMTPRLPLTAVPYAFQSESAHQLQVAQSGYTGTLQFGTLTNNRTLYLPDANGTICTDSGNCVGGGSGTAIGGSGTAGTIAMFGSGGNVIGDSILTQSGTNVTVAGTLTVNGAGNSAFTGTVSGADATANNQFVTLGQANGNYIQNQNTAAQTGSNFWIDGTGTAGSLQAASLDTATAGTLTIGGTNATSISLAQNTTVAAGKSLTLAGGATGTRPASPTEGMMYFDTSTHQMLTYANGKWQGDRHAATEIVAASDSSQSLKDAADYVADGEAVVGTGTIDGDQVQINDAIAALPSSGGTVYLAPGTYYLDGSIVLPSNVTLAGAGGGTVITVNDNFGSDLNMLTNSDTTNGNHSITIRDITFDGNRDGLTSDAIDAINFTTIGATGGASSLSGATIIDNTFTGFPADAIDATTVYNSTITGNAFLYSSSTGIYLTNSARTQLNNNSFDGVTVAIHLYNTDNSSANNNTINAATSVSGAIDISNGSEYNVFSGNTFSNNADVSLYIKTSHNNTVTGNNFDNNGGTGAYSDVYIAGNSNYNDITNNTFRDTAGTGYAIDVHDTNADNTYLAGNTMMGTGANSINNNGTGTIYGGQLDGSGNYMIQSASSVQLLADTAVTGDLTVSGSIYTTYLDTASAANLDIGTTNANGIFIGNGSATTTIYQGATVQALSNSGTTFQVQDAGSNTLFGVDTQDGFTWVEGTNMYTTALYIEAAAGSGVTGQIALQDSTGATTANIGADSNQNVAFGLGAFGDGNVSTGSQNVAIGSSALYSVDTGGANIAIGGNALASDVDGSDNIAIGHQSQTNTTGGDNISVGSSSGSSLTTGDGNILLGSSAGSNLTTGDQNIIIGHNLQALSATGSNQLNIGGLIQGNMATGSQSLTLGGNVTVAADGTSTLTIGDTTNGIVLSPTSGISTYGTAQHKKTLTFSPEYAGAVLDATQDSSCTAASDGTMTSGFDGTESYYQWTSSDTTTQCYDIDLRVPVPSDFSSWDPSGGTVVSVDYWASDATDGTLSAQFLSPTGGVTHAWETLSTSTANSWHTIGAPSSLSSSWTPGQVFTVQLRMSAANAAKIRLGDIQIHYNAAY